MNDMYTPIFKNIVHDVEFVFPRLYVPTKEYAVEVGKSVTQAAKNDNFADVTFTGKVADLSELAKDTENMRIIAPFDTESGEQQFILVLDSAGEAPKDLEPEDIEE